MAKVVEYLAHLSRIRPTIGRSLKIVGGPFAVMAGLFTVGVALGLFIHSPTPGVEPADMNLFGVEDSTWSTFAKNNLFVVLVLVSGTVLLGLPTFVTTILNGVLLGIIVADVSAQGVGLVGLVLLLLPHGIMEIPALLLAASVGVSVPWELVSYFRGERDQILRVNELAAYIQIIALAVLLVLLAAWGEANVTMQLYETWKGVPN